jgi:predicted dienelactone hydrolase
MLHRRPTWAHFALIIAVLLSLSVVTAQDQPKPEAVGLRPDAPAYALHGPYWVGTREFVIEDDERPLSISVWYPALNLEGLEESLTYTDIQVKFEPPSDMPPTLAGHALRDAPADMSGGPYPLIINSGGFGTYRQSYAFLTEHLASYGFVVLAPDHIERLDAPEPGKDEISRIQDLQRVIAYAEALTAEGGAMAGMIDMDGIAVMGSSSGAETSLALGGARINFKAFTAWCKALPSGDPAYPMACEPYMEVEAEMAAVAGLDTVPDGLWPSWGDPRIRAIIPIVTGTSLFQPSGLESVTIPMMTIGGTNDTWALPDWGAYPAYEYVSSQQKALVMFNGADHFTFWSKCADQPWLIGWFWSCSDLVWDMDRAHDLINHFTTAFLLDVLKGDQEAHAALAPEAVSFPGITYTAKGF